MQPAGRGTPSASPATPVRAAPGGHESASDRNVGRPAGAGPGLRRARQGPPSEGSGGSSPRASTASHRRSRKEAELNATPGGYGGKPPGVAIIGVPTGARNAGRCSDGGPEHRFELYTES